jgi:hypothetical protein
LFSGLRELFDRLPDFILDLPLASHFSAELLDSLLTCDLIDWRLIADLFSSLPLQLGLSVSTEFICQLRHRYSDEDLRQLLSNQAGVFSFASMFRPSARFETFADFLKEKGLSFLA